MPRLLSRKNLRYPTVDGQVLSSTKKGVQTWVDNKSVGISTLGAAVGTANTIKFASGVDVSIVAGVASVSVEKADKTVTKFTATADQTTFVASYALGYVDVFLNGVKLAEDQYTASNGTSIVLDEGAAVDDIIEIVAFNFTTGSSGGATAFATRSGFSTSSGISTESVRAGLATEAVSAGIATFATTAGIATFATTAGVSTQVSGYLGVGVTGTNLNLTGIITASGVDGIGIHSGGTLIHSGIVTALNFVGSGNTFVVRNNQIDISISGGSGGGGGSDGPDAVIMGMIF